MAGCDLTPLTERLRTAGCDRKLLLMKTWWELLLMRRSMLMRRSVDVQTPVLMPKQWCGWESLKKLS